MRMGIGTTRPARLMTRHCPPLMQNVRKMDVKKVCTVNCSNRERLSEVQRILRLIQNSGDEFSSYALNKNAISFIFQTIPDSYSYSSILVKLTVIDSLYSTQMGRRYYGLDELAGTLAAIHSGKSLDTLFQDLADGTVKQDDSRFSVNGKNLFAENYGIGKDGNDKGKAVSLISKYAYFETNGNFPIFDSIAREMYPRIWRYCGFPKNEIVSRNCLSSNIDAFIVAMNLLRNRFEVESLSYDDVDRLLWTTGKIIRGNLSLVLTMEEYLTLKDMNMLKDGSFNLEAADLNRLAFLNDKPLLKAFFQLAKSLTDNQFD